MVTSIPNRGNSSVINPYVPPYTSADATTWSPEDNSAINVEDIAAIPEEKTSPSSAPSSEHIFLMTASALTEVILVYNSAWCAPAAHPAYLSSVNL